MRQRKMETNRDALNVNEGGRRRTKRKKKRRKRKKKKAQRLI